MKLLIIDVPPFSCHFISLCSEYYPWNPVYQYILHPLTLWSRSSSKQY
jgi:hypothetical protein